LTDFRNLFTTMFRKELWNKNLLKFSPHLKSVAALPCETWNVKCDDIQQHNIVIFNSKLTQNVKSQ